MQLQTGKDQNGNPLEPGTVDQNTSKITGLTDIFVHLSYLEHSKGIYEKIYPNGQYDQAQHNEVIAFINGLLETYPHMPDEIKQDIKNYWATMDVAGPKEAEMLKVKQHACDEVQRMWEILRMC